MSPPRTGPPTGGPRPQLQSRLPILLWVALAVGVAGCSASAQEPSTAPSNTASAVSTEGLNLPQSLGLPELSGQVVSSGVRPVLAWDEAPGAASYQLLVRNAAGETTWAWTGSTTSIAVGGGTVPAAPDTPGALIDGPSTWTVVALDTASTPVAASADIEVSP